jgi:hypothetical protein
MPLTLQDHERLQEATLRAALAGGAAAIFGMFLPASWAAAVAALAIALAAVPPASCVSLAWAVLWAAAAGASVELGGIPGGMLGTAAFGANLARGMSGPRRWAAAGTGALGAATAALIARGFDLSGALGGLPSGIAALVAGTTGGLVLGLSTIGREIVTMSAPLESELAALAGSSEIGQLLGRAARAYRDAIMALGDEAPAARTAADELVRKMARFGRRWRELENEAARTLPAEVDERLALLGRRLQDTQDPLARAELARTREVLAAQRADLDEIASGRERAAARLMHQVATLERLRLAALRHRSADAARLGAELQPVLDELTQAGGDLDIAAEALTEATAVAALPARA